MWLSGALRKEDKPGDHPVPLSWAWMVPTRARGTGKNCEDEGALDALNSADP